MENQNSKVSGLLKERQQNWFYGVIIEDHGTAPMLVIHHKSGDQSAYLYHALTKKMSYSPSEGIFLTFIDSEGSETLNIQGKNLLPLWESLTRQRVTFIRELIDDFNKPKDGELYVMSVVVS